MIICFLHALFNWSKSSSTCCVRAIPGCRFAHVTSHSTKTWELTLMLCKLNTASTKATYASVKTRIIIMLILYISYYYLDQINLFLYWLIFFCCLDFHLHKSVRQCHSSSCYHPQMFNLVLSSHALVYGPTCKRPASNWGLYRVQVDYSGSQHSHAAVVCPTEPFPAW